MYVYTANGVTFSLHERKVSLLTTFIGIHAKEPIKVIFTLT